MTITFDRDIKLKSKFQAYLEDRVFLRSVSSLCRLSYDLKIQLIFLNMVDNQDPVVQSIVSLTISLRHKFVMQISAKVTNTLLFFVEKM